MWPILALLLVSACGGSGASGRDAGAGIDAGDDSAVEPASPAPPALGPCPTGWTERDGTCDPWPAGAPEACGAGEVHRVGGAGCALVGDACPEGDWAPLEDAGDVVYVRAGEAAGGDGTRARPFGGIQEAVDAAPDGGTVALSKGTFVETLVVDRPLMLRGACTGGTTITTDVPDFGGATVVLGGAARGLADVTISGSRRAILVDGAAGEVAIERVVTAGVAVSGLTVLGASRVRAADLVIRDVVPDAGYSVGIEVAQGSSLVLARSAIERATAAGLLVYGAAADVRDVAIRETQPEEPEGTGGDGIVLLDAAEVVLERVAVEGSLEWGIAVRRAGTHLDARDLLVRGVAPRAHDGGDGIGLFIDGGASVALARAALVETAASGIRVADDTSAVDANDLVTSGAIQARDDGTLRAARISIRSSAGVGALARDGGRLELDDARVEDVAEAGALGHGVAVAAEGSAQLTRFVVARCAVVGVQVGPGGALELADGVIAESPIGANVPSAGLVEERVVYRDDAQDVSDEALPVPE